MDAAPQLGGKLPRAANGATDAGRLRVGETQEGQCVPCDCTALTSDFFVRSRRYTC